MNVSSILHNFSLDINNQNEDIIFIQSHLVPQNVKYRTKKLCNKAFNLFYLFAVFGLDSPLSLFPPGMDPSKLYNPLMEMPDPRSMHPHPHGPFLKKKSKCKYLQNWCNI